MAERRLSFVQRMVKAVSSAERFAAMEAESRAWRATCPNCGHARSIWELGGIRAGAAGKPRQLMRCPACGARGWHSIER
jgi:transposase-like protein